MDFKTNSIQWEGPPVTQVPMRPKTFWTKDNVLRLLEVEPKAIVEAESHMTSTIKDADYHKVDILQVVAKQTHLATNQRNDLYKAFASVDQLFSGKLGTYPHKRFHLELAPDAVPYHSKPYQVPLVHQPTFKKELN